MIFSLKKEEEKEGNVKFQWHLDLSIDASLRESVCVCEHNHILHGNRNMILHEMGKTRAAIYRYIVYLMINH